MQPASPETQSGYEAELSVFGWLCRCLYSRSVVAAELRSDIEYAKVDGESLKLDASVPDGAGPFPVVIVVHGGGWSGGNKSEGVGPLVGPLTAGNFTWFSINYRLAPAHRWPACYRGCCDGDSLGEGACRGVQGRPDEDCALGLLGRRTSGGVGGGEGGVMRRA